MTLSHKEDIHLKLNNLNKFLLLPLSTLLFEKLLINQQPDIHIIRGKKVRTNNIICCLIIYFLKISFTPLAIKVAPEDGPQDEPELVTPKRNYKKIGGNKYFK